MFISKLLILKFHYSSGADGKVGVSSVIQSFSSSGKVNALHVMGIGILTVETTQYSHWGSNTTNAETFL